MVAKRQTAFAVFAFGLVVAIGAAGLVAQEARIPGRVVSVTDGDTIKVLVSRAEVTVRLWGIDAPEAGAEYAARAKQQLSDLVFDKSVVVVLKDTDRYGRPVAEVYVDETNVGLELVRQGLAWHYVELARNDLALAAAESEARSHRRNIWSLPNPLPPWEQRNLQRNVDAARQGGDQAARITYHGNRNSHVFHGPSCRYYTCQNCTARFTSREAAIAAGYRPCQICKP